jgi:membrane protein
MPVNASISGVADGAARDDRQGRGALGPGQIPVRGWGALLRRAADHFISLRLPVVSAGIAFFAVLSIAPMLICAVSLYAAVNTPSQASDQLSTMTAALPADLQPMVDSQVQTITTASGAVLSIHGAVALLLALTTATTAMMSLIEALTLVYREVETRSFLRRLLLAVGFVAGGVLLLGAVITAGAVATRAMGDAPAVVRSSAAVLAWILLAVLISAVFAFLYRFGPDRKRARWRWTTWGATGATTLWVAATLALFVYVDELGTYTTTYGSLAGAAIGMFWLWLSVLLVLAGAAANAESEHQTSRDSTVGPERPAGERGATVADNTLPLRLEDSDAPRAPAHTWPDRDDARPCSRAGAAGPMGPVTVPSRIKTDWDRP